MACPSTDTTGQMSMSLPDPTTHRKILAGRLLSAAAKMMCSVVYYHHGFYGAEEDDIDRERQAKALKGALFAHHYTAAFERISSSLVALGLAEVYERDLHRMLVDADDIPDLAMTRPELTAEADAIEAFFNYDNQSGWPEGFFPKSLLDEFRNAGLVEGPRGDLNWTPEMIEISNYILGGLGGGVPWDPDPLFDRVRG